MRQRHAGCRTWGVSAIMGGFGTRRVVRAQSTPRSKPHEQDHRRDPGRRHRPGDHDRHAARARRAGLRPGYDFVDAGVVALEKHGDLLPKATLDKIAEHKVALKGPLTTPIGGGFTSINVTLRRHFDLYANVRPVLSMPGTKSRYTDIDIITVRENT